jgi:SAM-dependent MidA family methyltransferase
MKEVTTLVESAYKIIDKQNKLIKDQQSIIDKFNLLINGLELRNELQLKQITDLQKECISITNEYIDNSIKGGI